MVARKLFPDLVEHLSQKPITVITGLRRVGKSTALKYLLGQISHENKLCIDLERIENRYIFQQSTYKDVQIDLEIQGIDFSLPGVIALDEIQLVPEITSILKWMYDTFPEIKFLVTGSSSFYLKNRFSESLAGRKHIFEMYPLDFFEFLSFKGEAPEKLNQFAMKPFQQSIFHKYKELYDEFLEYGGFPEVVLMKTEKEKRRMLNDIVNSYIDLDIRLISDFEAGNTLYKLILLLAARTGSPLDITKICAFLGIDRRKAAGYIELLTQTYFIHQVLPYTNNIDKQVSHRPKIYLADTGILNTLAKLNSGQVFENAIYLQLRKRSEQVDFYRKKSGLEIDFITDQNWAYEVKETPHAGDLISLGKMADGLKISDKTVIGKIPPGDGWTDFVWAGHVF